MNRSRPAPADDTVGIDALASYVPRLYVDLTREWAETRAGALTQGSVPALIGKVRDGVGVTRMAVPDAHEDTATLAAMAAKRVIDTAKIDPRDIDYLAVGTETTVDQSKSIASYVLGMLERHYQVTMENVGAPQMQFACIGATYALEAAQSRLRAGENQKPYALVIASDIAKYPLGSPGEYTQGAGAVAFLVSKNPRLLGLEPHLTGTVTRDERDFFRPNWTANAVVDGKYSIDVYLDCMEAACEAYARRAQEPGGPSRSLYQSFDHFVFHVPFPRMAEYAALRVFANLWGSDEAERRALRAALPDLPPEPPKGAGNAGAERRVWQKALERGLAKTSLFKEAFAEKVAPSLLLARDVGNLYSGSLYLALQSLFEARRADDLAGHRLALGSYGSGASAKMLSAVVMPRYREVTEPLRLAEALRDEGDQDERGEGGERRAVSVADYERLHRLTDTRFDLPEAIAARIEAGLPLGTDDVLALREALARRDYLPHARGPSLREPSGEFALTRLGSALGPERTDRGYRYYDWVK